MFHWENELTPFLEWLSASHQESGLLLRLPSLLALLEVSHLEAESLTFLLWLSVSHQEAELLLRLSSLLALL